MIQRTDPRPRKCRVCKAPFMPRNSMHVACSPMCALDIAKVQRAKAEAAKAKQERRATREAKERIKSRQDWLREAQVAVNRYVRLRDAKLGCVSCDRPASWDGQWHASHFRSVGAASAVRFHLWNIHRACSICNNHLSGNIAGYRPRLISRIGTERVEWLERQTQLVRYDATYLKRLKQVFTKKANRAAKRRELERA